MFDRHKTALHRKALSRPTQILLDQYLLTSETSFFDYGCGHGGDIKKLRTQGITVTGWDPHFAPDANLQEADIVNLGFVLNVIEDRREREKVLVEAMDLAKELLLVSVRSIYEKPENPGRVFGDGYATVRNTFQKYYDQTELKNWISSILQRQVVAMAPGVVAIFRDDRKRQDYLARVLKRRFVLRGARQAHELNEHHGDLIRDLYEEFCARGRMPTAPEWDQLASVRENVGSDRRAISVLAHIFGKDVIEEVRRQRAEDLLVFLALEQLNGRPKFSELSDSIRLDVRSFFGNYKSACKEADRLLFSAGNPLLIDAACRDAAIGKLTPNALYIHHSVLGDMEGVLRVYEGCARFVMGELDGANLIKLKRREPGISYLSYPKFQTNGHPELAWSYSVNLRELRAQYRDYRERRNPPLLHRKEEMVSMDDPAYGKFKRLTRSEERAGLLEDTSIIGLKLGWKKTLAEKDFYVRGHQLRRNS